MEKPDPDILADALQRMGGLAATERVDAKTVMERLAEEADRMIREDFARLVAILYRIDINESELKRRLAERTSERAGRIIAEMVVERLAEKKRSREAHRRPSEGIPEDERW
jgi:hypothetical protein